MKIFLVFFLCLIAVHSREYHYNKPNVQFQPEDLNRPGQPAYNPQQPPTIIPGNFGKNYEVSMVPSTKIFETRVQQNVAIGANPFNVQYQNQPQQNALTSPNPRFYGTPNNGNLQQQQPINQYQPINQQQSNPIANQYHSGFNTNSYAANAQQHLNQYSNTNQQQQHYYQQQHQQQGVITAPQQQQQQQPGLFSQQQQQPNTNVPNSNNLLNDLVNNNKYVSQSEASRLDVYPYKQLTIGNTRPFARFITVCDARGQCEQQNVADGGDFQHQQVLKQSKAKIEPISDKCRGYDYSPNSLNSQNPQNSPNSFPGYADSIAKGIATKKGTNLKDRRLFPYSEQVIPQYPTN